MNKPYFSRKKQLSVEELYMGSVSHWGPSTSWLKPLVAPIQTDSYFRHQYKETLHSKSRF